MTWYRKKPVPVRAAKYDAADPRAAVELLKQVDAEYAIDPATQQLWLVTVDGNHVQVPDGAYVVIDAKDWPYPCDAEIFDATHEKVTETLHVYQSEHDGQWYWQRLDGNHEQVGQGEGYTSEPHAITGALNANGDFVRAMVDVEPPVEQP